MTRRQREMSREHRMVMVVGGVLTIILCVLLLYLSPSWSERPLMRIYIDEGCAECRNWVDYVAARGFRTILAEPSELAAIRAPVSAPLGRRAPVVATVEGYVVAGFVPPREIHLLLDGRLPQSVKGLVVPGVPSGVPGITRGLPTPYTVYALHDGGLLQPIRTYNDSMHQHRSYLRRE